MRPLLAGAVVLAALAGAAPAAPPKPTPAQQGHCRAGETVVYSCRFGARTGSVCAQRDSGPGRIAYRFGTLGKAPELAITSTPGWENVHIGKITGGGGGFQNHMRFTRGDYHYIVFEAMGGNLTLQPGHRRSGIAVWQGEREMNPRACRLQTGGVGLGTFEKVWDFVPTASKPAVAEDDPRFEAWF